MILTPPPNSERAWPIALEPRFVPSPAAAIGGSSNGPAKSPRFSKASGSHEHCAACLPILTGSYDNHSALIRQQEALRRERLVQRAGNLNERDVRKWNSIEKFRPD